MSFFFAGIGEGATPFYEYEINNSIKLNDDDSAYFSRTPSSAGNQKTWTWCCWVKRCNIGSTQALTYLTSPSSNGVRFEASDSLRVVINNATYGLISTRVFRDIGSWYHICVTVDTTNATASHRLKLYVNGERITSFSTESYPTLNLNTGYNTSNAHYIGNITSSGYLDGNIAEVYFCDGFAYAASEFGEFKSGVWVPKTFSGSFGTNGYHLDFADNSTSASLGNDQSVNGNDWTANNITTTDQTIDSPTNNHCVLSQLDTGTTGTLSDGNLVVSGGNAKVSMRPSTGEWYYEKDGVGVSYDTGVSGQFNPTLTAGSYNFGQLPWVDTGPTGAEQSICSANLPAPDFEDGTNGITVTLDTETNIASSVATARTGWADYVDILKNRDIAEGWAYRFSHDSGNEYDVSTSATYQANRALSGTNGWVGYSIRVGSTYGTASGSASHTNGAATTVTHNLGTTDYAVLLFPRSGGAVKAHHPHLTSGDLLTLTSTAAETADATITNILSNSFDIGSGAATDTYDYLVLSSSAGLFYLGSYTGNASTNGTFGYAGLRSSALMIKRIDTTANWVMFDEAREGYNVDNDALTPNTTAAEGTADLLDILSNGLKCRSTDATVNASSGSYVYIAMQKTAFKYANAR